MKILMMRPVLEQGGVQRFMELLGGGLVARGHQVMVAAGEDRVGGRLAECGMVVRTFPLYPSTVANLALATQALARWVRKEQFDFLLSTHRFTTITGKLVNGITGVPLIVTLHERSRNLDRLARLWTGQRTVVPSQGLKSDLVTRLHLDPGRIAVIPNGITPGSPVQPEDLALLRPSLGLHANAPVIGYVGRLSPEKGVHILLESLHLLRAQGVPFQGLIVGDGVEGPALKERTRQLELAGQVIFAGSRADAPALMELMDVLAVPSVQESFGLVILEAMAAGLPVVGTRVGGIPELIQDHVTGLLTPPEAPGPLADALAQLLANRDLRRQMGGAGREIMEQEFSADVMVERYLALFQSCGGRPGGQ